MRFLSVFVAAVLCAMFSVLAVSVFAPGGPVFTRPAEAASAVSVGVRCKASPEVTTVRNNTSHSIKISTVGSIYRPRSNEPFTVNKTLGARGAISFESGRGANTNKLTGSYIYENNVGSREGARVRTSVGTFVGRC